MRARLGRPDLDHYRDLFDVPAAGDDLAVTFLGVSTLLFDDGATQILFDGFFSRPSLMSVGLRRIAPDETRIDAMLERADVRRLAAVVPVHSHYDHAMDAAVVALRTGADLVGGESTANVGRGGGLDDDRVVVVSSGDEVVHGDFTLTLIASEHCPPHRYPGTITSPVVPPVKVGAYRCGEAWSVLVSHAGGRSCLVQGSAGSVPGALDGRSADLAYLGVGQLGLQSEEYVRSYWHDTVTAVGARHAVLIHWDDFFGPPDEPRRALPYAVDDLDSTVRVLRALADEHDVSLHLPTLLRREDPWGLGR